MLDLEPFRKALRSLDEVLGLYRDEDFLATLPSAARRGLEAGVVQNFEFTYELAWKFMKRWLAENLGRQEVEGISRRHLFRLAAEHGLIEDVEVWMGYHQARNLTAHTYNERVAREIAALAGAFARDARSLLAAIESRND